MATATLTRRPSRILALIAVVTAVAVTVVKAASGQAKVHVGLFVDVASFAAIAVGFVIVFGPGVGLIAAGVGGLVLRDFGGN